MARFAGIGLFGIVAIGLWIYCILDVISSEESLVRNLPKTMWLMVVIFVPTVGSIAWLAVGRPLYAGFAPGDTRRRPRPARPIARGPEDDVGFIPRRQIEPPSGPTGEPEESAAVRERRLQEREAELERRERMLEERQETDPDQDQDQDQDPDTTS